MNEEIIKAYFPAKIFLVIALLCDIGYVFFSIDANKTNDTSIVGLVLFGIYFAVYSRKKYTLYRFLKSVYVFVGFSLLAILLDISVYKIFIANGIDDSPVVVTRDDPKGISNSTTLEKDYSNKNDF